MKKYYWLIVGVIVGVMSVALAYVNFNQLVQNGTLSLIGSLTIIAEYTAVIYLFSLLQKYFKK